jgi:hypothetical protein
MIVSVVKPMIHTLLLLFLVYIIVYIPTKNNTDLDMKNMSYINSTVINKNTVKEGFESEPITNTTNKGNILNNIEQTVPSTGYGYLNTFYTELQKEKLEYFVEPLPLQGIDKPEADFSSSTEKECKQLFDFTNQPTKEMKDLRDQFKKLDKDPMKSFEKLMKDKKMKIKENRLDKLVKDCAILSLKLKTIYNRSRPYQVCYRYGFPIKYLRSKHTDTPSYPSSYALQAYSVAFVLGRKYPKQQKELEKIANDLAWSRVYSGNNFVSDIECAKKIVLNLRIYLESVEL